jgi:hypothetical protein
VKPISRAPGQSQGTRSGSDSAQLLDDACRPAGSAAGRSDGQSGKSSLAIGSSRSFNVTPPLSAAALFGEYLVGVVLRNVFCFAPILWPFGQSDPSPGSGEYPRLKFCIPSLQPKSRGVARGVNV